ncbi:MAG: four helix bundle protein [Bacteroidota bacterium]
MRNDKDNLIVKLSFEFALKIVAYSEEIRQTNRFEMASQIFRSGTSIGANIREAQNAESKADEIQYWLAICKESEFYPNPSEELDQQIQSINLILSKIISSSKKA